MSILHVAFYPSDWLAGTGPFEIDHVTPWSRGGNHEADNLVVSCRDCNRRKGDRTPIEMGWYDAEAHINRGRHGGPLV